MNEEESLEGHITYSEEIVKEYKRAVLVAPVQRDGRHNI